MFWVIIIIIIIIIIIQINHACFIFYAWYISVLKWYCLTVDISACRDCKDRYFWVFVIIIWEAKTRYFLVFYNVMIVAT